MALPTNGRVIIDTTVGEIDIELWAKVPHRYHRFLWPQTVLGNTKNMSQFHHARLGGSVSFAEPYVRALIQILPGYYDNVIFHRYAQVLGAGTSDTTTLGSSLGFWSRQATKRAQAGEENRSMEAGLASK